MAWGNGQLSDGEDDPCVGLHTDILEAVRDVSPSAGALSAHVGLAVPGSSGDIIGDSFDAASGPGGLTADAWYEGMCERSYDIGLLPHALGLKAGGDDAAPAYQ